MRHVLDASSGAEIKARIAQLQPGIEPRWGKMNAAQALAHCAMGVELALGDNLPKRTLIGWTIGPLMKKLILKDNEPTRRNSPTVKGLVVQDDRDLETERERLCSMIDRFVAAGQEGCTHHPHSFFGRLTPQEWSLLMYKHLDHHLRQFGV